MSAIPRTCRYKRKKRGIRLLLLAVLFAVFSFATSLCIAYADAPEYEDYSDLAGKRISMLTGAPFEELVRSKVPDVGEFSYYNSIPDKTKNDLWEKWTGSDEAAKTLPEQDWPGRGGTVHVAVCDSLEPMSYVGKAGQPKGFDIEMILRIAQKLDMHVVFNSSERIKQHTIGGGLVIVF